MEKLESDLENFVRLCHLHEKVAKLEQALAEKDQEIARLREALASVLECVEDECRIDHHGYCQNHFVTIPCVVKQAQQALKETTT